MKTILIDAVNAFNADKVPRLAAALSYYIAFSIAPLMIVLITVVNHIISLHPGAASEHDVRAQIVAHLSSAIGADGARAVNAFMTAATAQKRTGVIANIVSWVFVLLGATGLFGALQDALNTIFEAPTDRQGILQMLRDRAMTLVMVVIVAVLLIASSFAQTAVTEVGRRLSILPSTIPAIAFAAQAVGWVLSLVTLTVLFALIYRILPDVSLPIKSIIRGAAITTGLFLVGEYAINLYLQHVATTSTYGAVGSLVVLLLWLNYSMQTILFGAELTKILDHRDAEVDRRASSPQKAVA